jgi:hypothetical protein
MKKATVVMFIAAAFVMALAALLPDQPRFTPKTKSPIPGIPCPPNCAMPTLYASPAARPISKPAPVPGRSPAKVVTVDQIWTDHGRVLVFRVVADDAMIAMQ